MSALHKLHQAHIERRQRIYAAAVKPARPVLLLAAPSRPEAPPPPRVPETIIPAEWKANRECAIRIMQAVCRLRGVHVDMLWSPKRYVDLVPARHMAIWAVMTILPNTTLGWVGKIFRRDHSTILYGFRKIEARRHELEGEIRAIGRSLGIPNLVTLKRDTSRLREKSQNTMPHCE